jgi:hypothetical protein
MVMRTRLNVTFISTLSILLIFYKRNGLYSLCLHTTFKHTRRLTVFLFCILCLWIWSLTILTSDRLTKGESVIGIYIVDISTHFNRTEGVETDHHNGLSAERGIRAKREV